MNKKSNLTENNKGFFESESSHISACIFLSAVWIFIFAAVIFLFVSVEAGAAEIGNDGFRTIIIEGPIEDGDSARFINNVSELDELPIQDRINIIINSSGGSTTATLTIIHYIESLKQLKGIRITTYTYSDAYSGAALIFLCGDTRIMGELASIMFHPSRFYHPFTGKPIDREKVIEDMGEYEVKNNDLFNVKQVEMIKGKTNLPDSYFKKDGPFENSKKLSALEAKKHGIAHKIIKLGGN